MTDFTRLLAQLRKTLERATARVAELSAQIQAVEEILRNKK